MVEGLTVNFVTKAPVPPQARVVRAAKSSDVNDEFVNAISWFERTEIVPSLLAYAPIPSGTPAMVFPPTTSPAVAHGVIVAALAAVEWIDM